MGKKETLEDLKRNGKWSDGDRETICYGRHIASAYSDCSASVCEGCSYEKECY